MLMHNRRCVLDFKRLLASITAVVILLITLSSCDKRAKGSISSGANEITIETFGSAKTEEPSIEPEPPSYVTPPQTEPTFQYTTTESIGEASEAPTASEPAFSSDISAASDSASYDITPHSSVMYANADVNVRSEPDASSRRLGHLDKDEAANVTGIVSNGWYRIEFEGGIGFINGRYLSEEKATAKTSEPPASETLPSTGTSSAALSSSDSEQTELAPGEDSVELPEVGNTSGYQALNYQTQKAVWFAYLDIDGWLLGADSDEFRQRIKTAFSNVRAMGCNTVYVHVRAFGDAYYHSFIYPFTAAYSGTVGVSPDYDPLEIMIEEAHSLGLSFHAWVDPMRTTDKARFSQMPDSYILKQWYNLDSTNGTYLVYDSDSGYYWLSPAYTAVRELISSGIAEIVSSYQVDGIHIDDYFYPTTDASFDSAAFSVSGWSDLSSWRKNVVSQLVKSIYDTVKAVNPTVLFGVSPQGNTENNRNKLYADIDLWCSSYGYLDYVVPQLYYGYEGSLPFDAAAQEWQSLVTNPSVSLVCGFAAYKVGSTKEWRSGSILSSQTAYIDSLSRYSGCAYYRYGSLFPTGSYMEKEFDSLLAAINSFN